MNAQLKNRFIFMIQISIHTPDIQKIYFMNSVQKRKKKHLVWVQQRNSRRC